MMKVFISYVKFQLTGLEGCQCRLARIVRNHIGCAMLVFLSNSDSICYYLLY